MKGVKQGVFIFIGVAMILLCVGLIFMKERMGGKRENQEESGLRTFSGPVETLIFEAGACEVDVVAGDTANYELSYEGLSYATISDSLADGELRITYRQDTGWLSKLFFNRDKKDTRITLIVPRNAVLERAVFEFGAAEIEMEQITAKKLSIKVGAGEINARGITATEQAELSVGAGAFYAENAALANAELECGMGEMEIAGSITGESVADCGVGSMQLTLDAKQESYRGELNCGLGEIEFGDITINGSGKRDYGAASAEHRMDIKCGIGEVDVRFY